MTLDKLRSTDIHSILILKVENKPSSDIYFENLLIGYNIDWTPIYMLPHLVMYNACDFSMQNHRQCPISQ